MTLPKKSGALLLGSALVLLGAGCNSAKLPSAATPGADTPAAVSVSNDTNKIDVAANKPSQPIVQKVTVTPGQNENWWVIKHGDKIIYQIDTSSGGEVDAEIIKESPRFTYVGLQPGGMGGYILFDIGWMTMWQVNNVTGAITEIHPPEVMIQAISDDERAVAGNKHSEGNTMIYVRNLDTSVEQTYPVEALYTQFGTLHFSPNGRQLAYAAAKGDPSSEAGAVMKLDLKTGKTTVVATTAKPNSYFVVKGWKNDTTIDYEYATTGF